MIWLIVAAGVISCGFFVYALWRSRWAAHRYAQTAAQTVYHLARDGWLRADEAESLNLLCEVADHILIPRREIRRMERCRERMMNDICQF